MVQPSRKQKLRSLFMGGILPILAFSIIEDQWGIVAGLIAGMCFGAAEIFWEFYTLRKVDPITWGGNGLLLVLGGISLFTQEGLWFKLQPALMEGAFALLLWGSLIWGRPLLLFLVQKQGAIPDGLPGQVLEIVHQSYRGMTFRLGVFFAIHMGLAIWAALAWSTSAWAILKGVGLTASLVAYVLVESLVLRYRVKTSRNS